MWQLSGILASMTGLHDFSSVIQISVQIVPSPSLMKTIIQVSLSNSCEWKVSTIAGEYGAVHNEGIITASEIFGRD